MTDVQPMVDAAETIYSEALYTRDKLLAYKRQPSELREITRTRQAISALDQYQAYIQRAEAALAKADMLIADEFPKLGHTLRVEMAADFARMETQYNALKTYLSTMGRDDLPVLPGVND